MADIMQIVAGSDTATFIPSTSPADTSTTTFSFTSISDSFGTVTSTTLATSTFNRFPTTLVSTPTSEKTSTFNRFPTTLVSTPTSEKTLTSVISELSTSKPASTTSTQSSTDIDGAITSPSQSQSPTPNTNHIPLGPIIGGILGGLVLVVVLLLLLYGRRLRKRYHLLPKVSGNSPQFVQSNLLVEEGPSAVQRPRGDSEISAPDSSQPLPQIPPFIHNDRIHGMDIIPFPFSESPLNSAKSGFSRSDPTIASTTPGIEESINPVLLQQTVNRLEREIADMQALLHSRNTDDEDQASESTLPPPYLS